VPVPLVTAEPTSLRGGLLRDRTFVAALGVAVVVALGFGLVVPVLPTFAREFGVGVFAATAVVAVFGGVRLVANVQAGDLADRIGSRKAVIYGLLTVTGSSLLCAVAPSYWFLLGFRGLGGLGSALFFTSLVALVVRTTPADRRGRALGMLQGAFLFGMIVGPAVGGLLASFLGLRGPFVVYGLLLAVAAGVGAVLLPRDAPPPRTPVAGARGDQEEPVLVGEGAGQPPKARAGGARHTWGVAAELCQDRTFLAALVMNTVSRWAATGVRFSLVPLFGAEVVGADKAIIGLGLGIAAGAHLLALVPAGHLSDRIGRKALGVPAYVVFAAASAGLIVATTVPAFLVALAVYGAGSGLTSVTPGAVVADVVPRERTNLGVGVLNTAGDLGSVLGPLLSGLIAQLAGYGWAFGLSAALLLVGAGAAARMRETLPARVAAPAGAGAAAAAGGSARG
jgi:MFS family permease